jgi:hypothetical protein
MDLEGKNAARSVTATRADGKGKAGGSNAQKPPPRPESLLDVQPDNDNSQSSAGPESLLTEPTRSSVQDSALPARVLHQHAQVFNLRPEATKWRDAEDIAAAREDRIDALEREGGSMLPARKGLRRQL